MGSLAYHKSTRLCCMCTGCVQSPGVQQSLEQSGGLAAGAGPARDSVRRAQLCPAREQPPAAPRTAGAGCRSRARAGRHHEPQRPRCLRLRPCRRLATALSQVCRHSLHGNRTLKGFLQFLVKLVILYFILKSLTLCSRVAF